MADAITSLVDAVQIFATSAEQSGILATAWLQNMMTNKMARKASRTMTKT
ncbi:hypothetical protein M409DRAFT_28971 [Zasmidium cellare ATCC 36951]|uniref:Uncharacterized protein n=1 Tax=Zasmidium cellare ATCC 36951 TaxID=1080233 RepID=A0A6A6C0T2_ZASCE|nr:uncharacterized protein M409DRAFT_28971 [Zasmidium cellare ATCC 36951]KAF2160585.1 hypothetical protein M409DRAFT_28971 [Zasmidium cellare ATCC 36951]